MKQILFILSMAALISSCDLKDAQLLNDIAQVRDSLKAKYAPDKRVALFDLKIAIENSELIVTGLSDQDSALEEFTSYLATTNVNIRNGVVSLPDASVGDTKFGLINNSVGNIRSAPKHSAELATQAVLGTEVKVLQIQEEWYLVQTPDGYISWIDHGGVHLMTDPQIEEWRAAEKVIVTEKVADVQYDLLVSDVVLGSTLKLIGERKDDYWVEYPDGRRGWLSKSVSALFDVWKKELVPSGELITQYALDLIGSPYLWGGTSTKGMDCSGFTKIIYQMNGLIIPRDASQQVNAGAVVDEKKSFEGLEKGDLVFFGKPSTDSTDQKVTHVGIWIGDQKFIHSSMRVRVSSIDADSPDFDEFNINRYLGARRYLDNLTEGITVF